MDKDKKEAFESSLRAVVTGLGLHGLIALLEDEGEMAQISVFADGMAPPPFSSALEGAPRPVGDLLPQATADLLAQVGARPALAVVVLALGCEGTHYVGLAGDMIDEDVGEALMDVGEMMQDEVGT